MDIEFAEADYIPQVFATRGKKYEEGDNEDSIYQVDEDQAN